MNKNLKILCGFFLTIMFFRYIPHLPNFTPVLAMTFYGTIIFGRYSLVFIVLAFALSDVLIGFHNQLIWTWGSLFLIGFIGPYFKNLFGRFTGIFFSPSSLSRSANMTDESKKLNLNLQSILQQYHLQLFVRRLAPLVLLNQSGHIHYFLEIFHIM